MHRKFKQRTRAINLHLYQTTRYRKKTRGLLWVHPCVKALPDAVPTILLGLRGLYKRFTLFLLTRTTGSQPLNYLKNVQREKKSVRDPKPKKLQETYGYI